MEREGEKREVWRWSVVSACWYDVAGLGACSSAWNQTPRLLSPRVRDRFALHDASSSAVIKLARVSAVPPLGYAFRGLSVSAFASFHSSLTPSEPRSVALSEAVRCSVRSHQCRNRVPHPPTTQRCLQTLTACRHRDRGLSCRRASRRRTRRGAREASSPRSAQRQPIWVWLPSILAAAACPSSSRSTSDRSCHTRHPPHLLRNPRPVLAPAAPPQRPGFALLTPPLGSHPVCTSSLFAWSSVRPTPASHLLHFCLIGVQSLATRTAHARPRITPLWGERESDSMGRNEGEAEGSDVAGARQIDHGADVSELSQYPRSLPPFLSLFPSFPLSSFSRPPFPLSLPGLPACLPRPPSFAASLPRSFTSSVRHPNHHLHTA